MKIVIATPLYPPEIGGPATYAKLLEEGLPQKGIEIELVKFSEVRHLSKLIRHYAYYRRVLKAARGADVILALDPVSTGLPAMWAAKKLGKPFVVKIVGDYAWEQGQQRFGITQTLDEFVKEKNVPFAVRILRIIQTSVARSATRIIVPSEYLKNIVATWGTSTPLSTGISHEKIEVIYNGIELPPVLGEPARSEGFYIVSSGRRVPWKGFEGVERVVARESGWHFFIASNLSRSETLGYVKSADVFVLNSSYEGLSHALLEALALGTPIIATKVGGNSEVITDGITGLLVPSGDDDALYEALKKVEQDPVAARARAVSGQAFFNEHFTVAAMLSRTSDVLYKLGHPVS